MPQALSLQPKISQTSTSLRGRSLLGIRPGINSWYRITKLPTVGLRSRWFTLLDLSFAQWPGSWDANPYKGRNQLPPAIHKLAKTKTKTFQCSELIDQALRDLQKHNVCHYDNAFSSIPWVSRVYVRILESCLANGMQSPTLNSFYADQIKLEV